jgi:DNA polymerase-3 subunit delta'
MNIAAANSLLKTLEEPPENTIIILIARHKETIHKTIVSRSQVLFFQALSQDIISTWLTLNCSLDSKRAKEIAELSEGSIENAKKLVNEEQSNGLSLWHKIRDQQLYISDILELYKDIARIGVLECVDAMTAEAKKNLKFILKRFYQL